METLKISLNKDHQMTHLNGKAQIILFLSLMFPCRKNHVLWTSKEKMYADNETWLQWMLRGYFMVLTYVTGATAKILTPTGIISIYLQLWLLNLFISNIDARAQVRNVDCCDPGIALAHLTSGETSSRAVTVQRTAFRIRRSVFRIQFSI